MSDDLTLKKGIELYQTGNRREAERLLAQSYESTKSVEAARYLGRVRYETGNADGAIEPLTRAAAAFKDDIRCHYYLGMALFTVGRNASLSWRISSNIFFRVAESSAPDCNAMFLP